MLKNTIPFICFLLFLVFFSFSINKNVEYHNKQDEINCILPPCLGDGLCSSYEYSYLKKCGFIENNEYIYKNLDNKEDGIHYGIGPGFYISNKGVTYKSYSIIPALKL